MLREFYGITEEQLLAWLRTAQEDLARGAPVTSFSNESGASTTQLTEPPTIRIAKLQRALYETDPVRYAVFACAGQNRTRPNFASLSGC